MKTIKTISFFTLLLFSFTVINAQELTNNIYFQPGKIVIDKRSYDELYDIADIMQALPDYDFLVAGHVDSATSPEAGVKISKMRADAVSDFLVETGVDIKQIETIGHGYSKMKYNNQTPTGRKKNRRVEISLKGSEEAVDFEDAIDADFSLTEIAKEYNIPIKLLSEWNKIQGKLSFLEGKNDQLNKNIHFRSGSMLVRTSSKTLLEEIANFMMKYPNTSFTIGGHTDSLGSIAYNKEVSQGRADACLKYFIKAGVNRKRLKTIAHGFTRPKFMNKKTWGKSQLNRRVEIVFDALNDYNIEKAKKIEEAQREVNSTNNVTVDVDETNKVNETNTVNEANTNTVNEANIIDERIKNLTISGMKKIYHKVAKKETLFDISQKYDISINNIKKWNSRVKNNTIYRGQTIVIFVIDMD